MPIIRANDPHANDKAYQVKSILGKLCDEELSTATKQDCVTKLTKLMSGMPFTEETFRSFGLAAKIVRTENEHALHVHVPKEFVASGIEDNREDQWVIFNINRALNTNDLKGDTAVITDMAGNPVENVGDIIK